MHLVMIRPTPEMQTGSQMHFVVSKYIWGHPKWVFIQPHQAILSPDAFCDVWCLSPNAFSDVRNAFGTSQNAFANMTSAS
jgi:hypothetical protein